MVMNHLLDIMLVWIYVSTAGDMWISGLNCCSRTGYTIGTPALNGCFNISNTGAITVDYRLITPLLYATTIRASNATVITLQDDVAITGNLNVGGLLSRYQVAPVATSVAVDIMPRLLMGIIINTFTTPSTLTLPTGTVVNSSIPTISHSIDWSVINTGTATGTLTIVESAGHTAMGNKLVAIGTSASFRTRVSALNTPITYRMY